ncbi:sigma-B regulation protein RsbU (phosphoserine phosphatase) [Hymenobacter luteus]|uniref:Sigma-B regulation protein RsbU (Phosphoserine phosphatase) n=2 Tax=Hymenobacter TaxID=89966 RepID=A0A7W9WAC0_9BACT|nr:MULTISPECIES: PP2C family protein-serine/threonine phosphatase [Hymenobacter]MBB4601194.1 sigma-B regulation protein RsbU (phosphoserine phosphatase) [Hymenobacter latericoloratus]MBB6058599.1 sigma-B regulation protein RsbU (phosphoserine phosphatase) [Hymenobacter luteus]
MPTITPEKRLFLKERELGALLEITQAINQDPTEAALYKIFQFTLLGQLNIRRLVLYVKEEGKWQCTVSFGAGLPDFYKIALPAAILENCTSVPCPLSSFGNLGPAWQHLETVIPVVQNGEVLAYVLIGNVHEDYASEEATKFLQTLSNILIGAIENRRLARQRVAAAAMRKEIEIAQEVQTMLFPRKLPNDAHVAVHASYVPHTAVGGDYYDVVSLDADRFLFCVADVSGKGVAASLLMSNFQAGLRTLLRQQADLGTVAQELNNLIFRNAGGDKFITVFFGLYNRATRELQYVNAGHNDPLLIPDSGPILLLKEGSIMLGVMDELPMLKVGTIVVPPRTLLFSYTDGLTEVFDKDQNEFGEEGVLRVLRHNRYAPLSTVHRELLREIEAHNVNGAGFADDVTILSCRFK